MCRDEVAAGTSEWHRAKEELSNLARQSERRSALETQACLLLRLLYVFWHAC